MPRTSRKSRSRRSWSRDGLVWSLTGLIALASACQRVPASPAGASVSPGASAPTAVAPQPSPAAYVPPPGATTTADFAGTWVESPGVFGKPKRKGPLFNPTKLRAKAPPVFRVKFQTSQGAFVVQVTRAWAPRGADRFFNLVKAGYYDGIRFHRVVRNRYVHFGVHGDPAVNHAWFNSEFPDDPQTRPNLRGTVSFLSFYPDTRRTELVINVVDNPALDEAEMAPFGEVIDGMKVVERLRAPNKDPQAPGPVKAKILTRGNRYLAQAFPHLDSIKAARVMRR
ncbi:MAG TPA: peptidylprolyl isomerase [Polyangia bacterium]